MQLVADDLDVRPLLAEHADRRLGHRLPEGVVLADDVDLPDLGVRLDHVGQRRHLHVGVRVEAEVPEVALLVGQRGIDRRVVQVEDAVVRVALIVLEHRVRDGVGHARAVALEDEVDALADHLLELDQGLLRADLVVEGHDLERPPEHAAGLVDLIGREPELLEPVLARRRDRGEFGCREKSRHAP